VEEYHFKKKMDKKAVEVINLKKSFKNFKIIDGLSFSIDYSKRVLIFGKNGSGKTTLLKILSCYLYPDYGDINILGFKIPDEESKIKGKVFYISPEERSFYFPLSVEKNLKFYLKILDNFDNERLNFYVEHFKIKDFLKKPFSVLSSGEKQRVALVRAFSLEPDIFLFDEPQKSLDSEGLKLLKDAIDNLKEKTFLIASPKKEELEGFYGEEITL